jgi:hypothetical protein
MLPTELGWDMTMKCCMTARANGFAQFEWVLPGLVAWYVLLVMNLQYCTIRLVAPAGQAHTSVQTDHLGTKCCPIGCAVRVHELANLTFKVRGTARL